MSGRNSIYWDTCIFLAWIKNEERVNPDDMQGVYELATKFDMGQVDIVTSVITITEILQTTISEEQYNIFKRLYSKRNFLLVDVTRHIAEIAQNVRNYYYAIDQPCLKVPDCIHLATALEFDCEFFYTFDGSDGTPNKLLTLPKPLPEPYTMKIVRPSIQAGTQYILPT